jgi:hypothetical protein
LIEKIRLRLVKLRRTKDDRFDDQPTDMLREEESIDPPRETRCPARATGVPPTTSRRPM